MTLNPFRLPLQLFRAGANTAGAALGTVAKLLFWTSAISVAFAGSTSAREFGVGAIQNADGGLVPFPIDPRDIPQATSCGNLAAHCKELIGPLPESMKVYDRTYTIRDEKGGTHEVDCYARRGDTHSDFDSGNVEKHRDTGITDDSMFYSMDTRGEEVALFKSKVVCHTPEAVKNIDSSPSFGRDL